MFVSNITSSWGLEESNFVWMNNAGSPQDARAKLTRGRGAVRQQGVAR